VLFADLKASTELIADLDPEDARKLLDPVLELMMEAVHHYEGTVNQVMGDGIMALFGAPLAHEDHAVRACYAALRMQEGVRRHAEGVLRARGIDLRIRVGLNSGYVVVRSISNGLHMDYSALGRTTHLAARMEQIATPGSILITRSTLALAEGFMSTKALGAVPVKGLADRIEIYELTGVRTAQTRFQAGARHGLTPFIGREAELEKLHNAQRRAGDGRGQVVALVAEPGVGKSRLVHELAHAPGTEGWLVLTCSAVSYGRAMSYLPVINLLKGYFEISEQDSVHVVRDKVTTKLLALDRASDSTLSPLLSLLDVPTNDASWHALHPGQRRQRRLDAVRLLLLREARRQPIVLILEDLHWIDLETQAFLDGLVESLGSTRMLVLATYRPEYEHGWGGKRYYLQLQLEALPADGAAQLLNVLLGDDPSLQPLKQRLVRRGNPFFLEETVRTLVETKSLEGERGHYRLARLVEAIDVPATVQIILAARIDRLSVEDKRLLQVAAVIGRQVPISLLRAAAELPDESLSAALQRLQAAEFVYPTGLFQELEYSFKHALTQDVAYGSLLQDRRKALHARIVDAIEALHHNRLGEYVELLAHHAYRGELREKAVSYLFQAGEKAARRSAPRMANVWYQQALDQLETLPETAGKWEQSFDVLMGLRAVEVALGETKTALQHLREAEAFAEKLNDDRRRGTVWARLASAGALQGELNEAVVAGTRAVLMAERLGDDALRIEAQGMLAWTHYYRADFRKVVELAEAVLEATASVYHSGSLPSPIYVRGWLIRSLAELGQFAEAAPHARDMIELAEPTQSPYPVGQAHLCAGWYLLAKGDWAQAWPHVDRGTQEYRKGNIRLALPHGIASSALILSQTGEASHALSFLQEGEELLTQGIARGTIDQAGMDYGWLGRAALLLGRLDDAQRLADLALENSPSHPGYAAHALRLLGDLAAHSDRFDADQSEAHYCKSLALAEARVMGPLVAHCRSGLGKLYHRIGKRQQAHEHLTIATSMYREMDMRFYLEKAEASIC
jgi:class 3 adenylate cyclase/tetratricopeptide (TPR) repeat protein